MTRTAAAFCLTLLLAACSAPGTTSAPAGQQRAVFLPASGGSPQFASGEIANACLKKNRRGASPARCGCVQAVANRTLTPSEKRRGAAFFGDPERVHEMKVSDSPANERFWEHWSRFADQAELICSST
ncbi:hypothetical protein [uncultured Roseobacter sp.]|uniref:hypothetical protein n=1 Tax=uncultured Roseobacter sp. TaxID=114847 RepID=UPI002620D102|nr:hypothetical protein [uncultured Roseobacter sp.]